MNLTLRQVRAFIAVAELAHFTRAGERLGLSQSSVSTLVRELEDNLGLRLFDRHTRMLRLTQAGAEMLPLARKALADLDRAFGSSQDLRSLGRGRVKVAAASLQAALLLPRVMKDFCAEFSGVRIDVLDVNEYEVIEKLRAGEVDFGLGSALAMQDIVARPLTTDTFVAVMPEDHPLARQTEVTWRDLADIPLIGPPPGNAVREQLDIALARAGITLRRSHEVILPLTILGMVEGGLGIAVMTSAMSRLALALGLVTRDVSQPVIQREMSLLFHADRTLSPAAEAFSDRLRASCRESVAATH
jgi:LysR family carnitine catabolism transcriptional activator